MSNIFSDLNDLGIIPDEEMPLFGAKEKTDGIKLIKEEKVFNESELLYESSIQCPICDNRVPLRLLKSGKVKLLRTDLDLRPIYAPVDPAKYEVFICPRCGYAALRRKFGMVNIKQAERLKEKVSTVYRGKEYPEVYDIDTAIERYKLALYDATVMEVPNGERAYLCLKLAWLYRGKAENIQGAEQEKAFANEMIFIRYAYEGFNYAYENERFPIMGIDEITVTYLLGELARRLGERDIALKWLSTVVISNTANKRLKERAIDSKELIKKIQV